jgi:hypothetical protein
MDRPGYFRFSKLMNHEHRLIFWFTYFSGRGIPCFIARHDRLKDTKPIGYTLWRQGKDAHQDCPYNIHGSEEDRYLKGVIIKEWPEPGKEVQGESDPIQAG